MGPEWGRFKGKTGEISQKFVIPAEAGIQAGRLLSIPASTAWIPACAGMTERHLARAELNILAVTSTMGITRS
jgi:hypothetical protein